MKDQDYELISQYLDGELPAGAELELKQRLLAEPDLRASLNAMQEVDTAVRDTFTALGTDTVRTDLVQMLQPVDAAAGSRANWGLALAASVLVAAGAVLVQQFAGPHSPSTAAPQLAHVLESSYSSGDQWTTLADGDRVRPVLTFRIEDGSWCREYLLSSAEREWRGVACRRDHGWTTEALGLEAGANSASEYRPASSSDAEPVADFARTRAAGIALSAQDEAELIANGWR
jgi:hypothetical protein